MARRNGPGNVTTQEKEGPLVVTRTDLGCTVKLISSIRQKVSVCVVCVRVCACATLQRKLTSCLCTSAHTSVGSHTRSLQLNFHAAQCHRHWDSRSSRRQGCTRRRQPCKVRPVRTRPNTHCDSLPAPAAAVGTLSPCTRDVVVSQHSTPRASGGGRQDAVRDRPPSTSLSQTPKGDQATHLRCPAAHGGRPGH